MSVSGRRIFLAGSLAAVGAALVAPAARAAGEAPAVAPISALYAGLLTVMKEGHATPFPQRFATLAPMVDRAFDLPGILRTSVGLLWPGLPQAQKARLQTVFRSFTIATYAANFDSYSGERFTVAPALRAVGAERVVETHIVPASGGPTRIDYVMRPEAGAWKAVDVLLDGTISRVAVQRSDFRSALADGDASRLIALLARKTAQLSGGTVRP